MIREKEIDEASVALIRWFQTQDINSPDGVLVMCRLIANQLITNTKDVTELERAANNIRLILIMELALILKAKQ